TLYCGSSNGIVLSSVDAFSNPGQAFEASMKIGVDTDAGESSRTFNGSIDDVSFFRRALSSTEISAIYDAGVGIVPNLLILKQSTNTTVFQGQPINLSVQVSGLNPHYQWYKTTSPIAGATNNTYTIAKAKVNDGANYYVVVTNGVNSVTSSVITVTVPTKVVLPWGASGAIYTNVSASSSYPDPNYVSANLFDSNLAGVALGTHLSGKDWADDGYGTSFAPAYVAFQVDQSYAVDAILYAQRNSQSGQTIDKITGIRLWASTTTPFSLNDPGTTPDAVISIPDTDAAILHAYLLPATVTGQYFLIEVDQNPIVTGSNFGGNEFRLGTLVTPVPLSYTYSAAGLALTWPAAATLQQADDLTGPWVNATDVTNGVPVSPTAAKRFYRIQY
ncbi:MAG TPA: immunoglobulin domain-containing protein, partial [Verrucomicrobiae bacterium]|nr:immunoglobulin domain-containing protein [Verrucomicrobiae bacterium]